MHIYLVRHTEYENIGDVFAFFLPFYLSKEGRQRAKEVGKWLNDKGKNLPITTSPIVRAVQTAEIITSQTNSFVKTDDRLIEVACPNLQGVKQPEKPWLVEEKDPSRESREKVKERILSIFNEKINEGKDCVLVSHGEGLTILYYHLLNKPLPEFLWSADNKPNIVQRGDIVDVEIKNNEIISVIKHRELN